jgi:uncharacterized damage-inducible protein DinB
VDRALTVASLRATPALVRGLCADCPPGEEWTPPKPGEWSIAEVVRHLVEAERDTFLPRLRRMVAEVRPAFETRRPATGDRADLDTLLAALEGARRQSVAILAALDPAGWLREGVSPSRGPLTIEAYAGTMADHDTEHLGQIHDVRTGLGLRPKRCEARVALDVGDVVQELRTTPARIAAVTHGLSVQALKRRGREGEWSIKEVMAHLLHVERELFLPRLRRLAEEERPQFPSFSPEAWAASRDHRQGRFEADLEAFAAARRETISFLDSLPAAAFGRIGFSAYFGPVTIAQYATHVADHDLEHLAQMEACKAP